MQNDIIVMPVKLGLEFQFRFSRAVKEEDCRDFILGSHGNIQCLHKHNRKLVPRITCTGPLKLSFPEGDRDHGALRPLLSCTKCGFDSQSWFYINLSVDEIASWELRLARWIYSASLPSIRRSPVKNPFTAGPASDYALYNSRLSEQQNDNLHLALIPSKPLIPMALSASSLIISELANASRQLEQNAKRVLGH